MTPAGNVPSDSPSTASLSALGYHLPALASSSVPFQAFGLVLSKKSLSLPEMSRPRLAIRSLNVT